MVVINDLVSKYGEEPLLEAIDYKKVAPYVLSTIFAAGIPKVSNDQITNNHEISTQDEEGNEYGMTKEDYALLTKKTEDVTDLISKNLEKNGKSIDDIEFDIKNVVYLCYKHNFDLPLMLAQMQCESHFGTDPRARRTGSVISIGQWDNKTVTTYDTQDDCFEPYILIMKRDYLQDGKVSVDDLLKPGCFVNTIGNRYAGYPDYEDSVRRTRNSIIKRYPDLAKPYSSYQM